MTPTRLPNAELRRTPLYDVHKSPSAPRWCPSPAGRCRCSTRRHPGRAPGGAHRRWGSSTSPTWASSRSPAPTGTPSSTGSPATTSARSSRAACSTRRSSTTEGTFVDDCTVYRFDDKLMIVVNAANIAPRPGSTSSTRRAAPTSGSRTSPTMSGCSRVQGPDAEARSQPLTDVPLDGHRLLPASPPGKIAGAQCFISRTGYTGEDGFELYCRDRGHRDALGGADRGRRHADRPRRARLAPARDGLRALRQRDRRHHHAARGRAGLDREARQGRAVHRATRRCGRRSSAVSPGSWSASGWRAAASRGTAIRCGPRASRWTGPERHAEPVARRRRSAPPSSRPPRRRPGPSSRSSAAARGCRPRW